MTLPVAMLPSPPTRQPPPPARTWHALLRADFVVQWRQRRSLIMTVLVPITFLIAFKDLIPTLGAHAVLAICIAVGLPAMGLMGYSQTIAQDREKGVFQRLRTTPTSTSAIMGSRIVVQLAVTAFMTLCTYAFANAIDGISLGAGAVLLLLLAALVGGTAYLAVGLCIVALIKSAEAVSAAGRLIYLPVAVVGGLAAGGVLGRVVKGAVVWSPLGTTKALLLAAMNPATIGRQTLIMLLATFAYSLVFATIGVRWFKWSID